MGHFSAPHFSAINGRESERINRRVVELGVEPHMSESTTPIRPESSRHAISVLIVTAAILWNLVALTRATALRPSGAFLPEPEVVVWAAGAYAQVMLAAGYLAWGRWNVAIRAALVLLVLIASSAIVNAFLGTDFRAYVTFFSSIVLGIALPLSGVRFCGLHLIHPEQSPPAQRRGQFSLWKILSLTAAVAILLTLSRWTVPDVWSWQFAVNWLIPNCMFGIVCLAAPLAVHRWWWSASMTAVASVAMACWYLVMTGNRQLVVFVVTQWILVSGCSGVIRLVGYRLTWQSNATPYRTTASAPPHTTARPGT